MTFELQPLKSHPSYPPASFRFQTVRLIFLFTIGVCCAVSAYADNIVDSPSKLDALSQLEPLWAKARPFRIEEDDLKRHVSFLASDTIEGRESGSPGGRAAGAYIVDELRKYGLKPGAADNDFYQEFGNGYRNILAILPGVAPASSEDAAVSSTRMNTEYIMIGAHYDHVGYGNSRNSLGPIGQIHNGADDNASGTALLLELARELAKQPSNGRRSILFAFWDAEERGLVGSRHWVSNPTISLDSVKFYFNYDMVGRLDEETLEVYGVRTTFGQQQRIVRHNHDPSLRLKYNWDNKADSDHYPFYEKHIPYLMLHTGKHEDYHRPSDDAPKLNYAGLCEIGELSARLLWDECHRPDAAMFRKEAKTETESTRQGIALRGAGLTHRLGMITHQNSYEDNSLFVKQVYQDSPAQKAGLRSGDVILNFGDFPISEVPFETLALKADGPTALTFVRPPSTERNKILIRPQGNPQLLGVGLYLDAAEPGSAIITRVRPESPAFYAELEANDVIWAIEGTWPRTRDEFFKTLQMISLEEKHVHLIVEREGRLREIDVNLWPEIDRMQGE